MVIMVVTSITTSKDHALLTFRQGLGRRIRSSLGDGSSPSDDCIVLGKCRKELLQELFQEIWENWNMPIAASNTHATWGITLLMFLLIFPWINKINIEAIILEFWKDDSRNSIVILMIQQHLNIIISVCQKRRFSVDKWKNSKIL